MTEIQQESDFKTIAILIDFHISIWFSLNFSIVVQL